METIETAYLKYLYGENNSLVEPADVSQFQSIAVVADKPVREGSDLIFPSDNHWGIPHLLKSHEAKQVSLPFYPHNKVAITKQTGTIHFYVDDHRFDALWAKPEKLKRAINAKTIVEPNFTISLESPLAWVIYSTFKKRWLARYCQSLGLSVIVDANFPPYFKDICFAGVPEGWTTYATRAYKDRIESLLEEYEMCVEHSEHSEIIFIVYGGGKSVKEYSTSRRWLWMPDESDRCRGRVNE